MKKLIPILLLITIIVSCIFAFTACSYDGITKIEEWSYVNSFSNEKYIYCTLEFKAKQTITNISLSLDEKATGANIILSPFNIAYTGTSYQYCKGDKIRVQVEYHDVSALEHSIYKKPNEANITVTYRSGKTETLVYHFAR